MNDSLDGALGELLAGLTATWNSGDASWYATYFHPDVDFVDVLGRHLHGTAAVAEVHRRNFPSIHLGSRLAMRWLRVMPVGSDLGVAVTSSAIQVPAGPLAGDSAATQTLLL